MGFTYGSNVPGFLPDSEPTTVESFDDARQGLLEQIADDALATFGTGLDSGPEVMALAEAAWVVYGWTSSPGTVTAAGMAYWIASEVG